MVYVEFSNEGALGKGVAEGGEDLRCLEVDSGEVEDGCCAVAEHATDHAGVEVVGVSRVCASGFVGEGYFI